MKLLKYGLIIIALVYIIGGSALSPFLQSQFSQVHSIISYFNNIYINDPWISYLIFAVGFSLVILFSVPLDSALMVLAGATFNIWEAVVIVTLCRFFLSLSMFSFGRKVCARADDNEMQPQRHQPKLLRKFNQHPIIALIVLRIAPVPESLVSFGMSRTSMRLTQYALLSILSMIPLSTAFVMLGRNIDSISSMLSFIG